MDNLGKRKDIIINLDKGDVVVIMDTEKCVNESKCQLSYQNNYKLLQEYPTTSYQNT